MVNLSEFRNLKSIVFIFVHILFKPRKTLKAFILFNRKIDPKFLRKNYQTFNSIRSDFLVKAIYWTNFILIDDIEFNPNANINLAFIRYQYEAISQRREYGTLLRALTGNFRNSILKHPFEKCNRYNISVDSTKTKNTILAIVPTYKNYLLTKACIDILLEVKGISKILIIDDDPKSSFPTKFLKDKKISYRKNTINLGFLRSVNQAYDYVKEYDYFFLVNNDCFIFPNCFQKLYSLSIPENVSIIGFNNLTRSGKTAECGGELYPNGSARWKNTGAEFVDEEIANGFSYANYVSGNAMLIKTTLIQKRGFIFDERYEAAYFEDSDLCMYARSVNTEVVAVRSMLCVHLISSTYGENSYKEELMELNRLTFTRKWHKELLKLQERRNDRTLFWIDSEYPKLKNAGGVRVSLLIKTLFLEGYNIVFYSSDEKNRAVESIIFDLGITTLDNFGTYRLEDLGDEFNFIFGKPKITIISRYLNFIRFYEYTKTLYPKTNFLYDVTDLHGLRVMGHEKIEEVYYKISDKILRTEINIAKQKRVESIFVSKKEINLFKENKISSNKLHYVSHPVKFIKFQKKNSLNYKIGFIGNFSHTPNFSGLHSFLIEANDILKSEKISLLICGANITNEKREILESFSQVDFLGEVSEKEKERFYSKIRLTIAPLFFGAGVKGKVIESISMGVCTVGTSTAFEGLPVQGYEEILVSDNNLDIAQKVIHLMRNTKKMEAINIELFERFKKEFDQEVIKEQFLEVIRKQYK